jgi:hypothetical protein
MGEIVPFRRKKDEPTETELLLEGRRRAEQNGTLEASMRRHPSHGEDVDVVPKHKPTPIPPGWLELNVAIEKQGEEEAHRDTVPPPLA